MPSDGQAMNKEKGIQGTGPANVWVDGDGDSCLVMNKTCL